MVGNLRKVLYLAAAAFLLIGLSASSLIYLTAGDNSDSDLLNQFERSKRYSRDVQLYGGKVNVLADDISRYFLGLWQGKSLAFTIACITTFVSLGIVGAARYLSSRPASSSRDRNEPFSGP